MSRNDDIDRILLEDDVLVPSSGFVGSVMEAVHVAAESPAPLRFPWRRFSIGIVACLVWAAAAISLWTLPGLPSLAFELSAPAETAAPSLHFATAATLVVLAVVGLSRWRSG